MTLTHWVKVGALSLVFAVACFALVRIYVHAADGSGSTSVTPASTRAGTTGAFVFTTTSTETMSSGEIAITVPSAWTAPQGTAGSPGYTTAASTNGMVANVLDTADSLSGWATGNACTAGLALDTATRHEGTSSIRCTNGNEASGDRWYKNITAQNWSNYTKVGFWIYSSAAIANTRLTFAYDNDANIASPIEEVSFGVAIAKNTWTYVVVPFASAPASRTLVTSFGFVIRHGSALDNAAIRIDDLLIGPGVPTFSGNDIRVRLLQLTSGQTTQITYGAGGGVSGATAPTTTGTYTFATRTRISDSGSLQPIGTSPSIQVTAATATRFIISPPGNGTAGTAIPVTIRALDSYGNVDTTYQQDVTLNASGSATGEGLINIVNGVGTTNLNDTVAESVHLTLTDSQGTGLDTSSNQDTVFSPGPVAQFTLTGSSTMVAGTRLGSVVTRRDQYGNIVTTGSNTVHLYSNSSGASKAFYDAATSGNQITSLVIGNGTSTASFWYYDDKAGSSTLTASDNASAPDGTAGIDDAASAITVQAAPTHTFLLTDPGNMTAGTRLGYVVARRDVYGNPVTSGDATAYLYSSSSGTHAVFYNAASGGSQITSLLIGNGTSTAQFWYYDELAGAATLTVSDNASAPDQATGIIDANDALNVTPAATARFLLNDPGDMTAETRTGYTVRREDGFGNVVIVGSDAVYLTSSSTSTNKAFYLASSGGSPVSSVTISGGSSSASFWYYDDRAGTYNVTASDNASAPDGNAGIDDATDSIHVAPVPIVATRFVILPPSPGTVDGPITVTVEAQNDAGALDTSYQQNVTLHTSGSATGGGVVDVVNGVGTQLLTNTVAETSHLTLTDSEGTGLGVASTQDAVFAPGAVSRFALSDPGDMVAGTRLGYVVTREDQYGNRVTSGSTSVHLYSNSAGANASFYNAASGGSALTGFSIGAGTSTGTFWYYDEEPGDWMVTASDHTSSPDGTAGIDDAADAVHVAPAPIVATRFVILPPSPGTVDGPISVTIEAQNNAGALATSYQQDVTLHADGSAAGAGLVNIVNGTGTIALTDTVAETVHLTLTDSEGTGLNVASTQSAVFGTGAVSRFLLNDPGDVMAGTRLGYVVTREDQYGNRVTDGDTTVYLYSNSSGSPVSFYDAPTGGAPVTTVTIGAGTSTTSFWYYDERAGDWTITASDHAGSPDGATGIDDAADALRLSPMPVVATRFTIISPPTATVDAPLTVTVEAQNDAGALDTSYQQDVTLHTTGSATGGGLVDLVNGVGTISISDTVAETVQLSLSDSQSTGLSVTSTRDAVFAAGAVSRLLLSDPGDAVAGTRLGYAVTREDQYGNRVVNGDTTVYLYSGSTGSSALFYDVSSGGSPVAAISIGTGTSTASFWYYDEKAGDWTITVSDHAGSPDGAAGAADAEDVTTVQPASISQLLLSHPGDMVAGTRLGFVLSRQDPFGNLVSSGTFTAHLFSDSLGAHKAFYPVETDGAPVTSVGFANGSSTTSFWYSDDKAGSISLTASDHSSEPDGTVGVNDATDSFTIHAGPTSRFLLNDPGNMTAGTRLGYTVTREDAYGNLVLTGSDAAHLFSSSSGTSTQFYSAASGGSPLSSISFIETESTASFWYSDDAPGAWTVTASDSGSAPDGATGIQDGTDAVEVLAIPIVATRFVLSAPETVVAGAPITVTVRAEDGSGNLDTTYQQDVTVNASGSVSGSGLADIVNGVGTITLSDTVAEITRVSLADTQGTGLEATQTKDVTITPAITARYTLSHTAVDPSAGSRIALTIGRQDAYANLVTAGSETVYLFSNTMGDSGRFYDADSAGSEISSVVLSAGQSSTTVWYADTHTGSVTVKASDRADAPDGSTGVADGEDSFTVQSGPTARLVLNDPGDMTAGTRIGYTVGREDEYGNPVINGNETYHLFSNAAGTSTAFYNAPTGGTPITSMTLPAGISMTSFWYEEGTVGTWTVTATDNATAPDGAVGIQDGEDGVLVHAIPIVATRLVILPVGGTAAGGSVTVTIRAENTSHEVDTAFQQDVTLALSGSATGGGVVDIVNGVGTSTISDAVAETVHLSLTDTEGTGLDVTSFQNVVFSGETNPSAPPPTGSSRSSGSVGGAFTPIKPQPKTILRVSGQAYPGADIVLVGRTQTESTSLLQERVTSLNGTFSFEYKGPFEGFSLYGVRILDREGRTASTIALKTPIAVGQTTEERIAAPPTIDLVQSTLLRGLTLSLLGYAAPESTLQVLLDNSPIPGDFYTEANGNYRILLNTFGMSLGAHTIAVRQVLGRDSYGSPSESLPFFISETLTSQADFNQDGKVDIADWSIFLSRWNSTDPEVRKTLDVNNDGVVDVADFSIFIRTIRHTL